MGCAGGGEVIVDERLAFTLGDGRAGVLSVCGRHVADARAKRPVSSNGQPMDAIATAIAASLPSKLMCCIVLFLLLPMDAVATAIAAWGHTVVLGDSWGQLGVWDTLTGKTTTMPTGIITVGTFPTKKRLPLRTYNSTASLVSELWRVVCHSTDDFIGKISAGCKQVALLQLFYAALAQCAASLLLQLHTPPCTPLQTPPHLYACALPASFLVGVA
eukprot:scaffold85987_cov19-Tisochrysis_lutea.AAC.2